jgi:hypothetical protein
LSRKEKYKQEALKAIESDSDIIFVEDIICSVSYTKTTFYEYKLNESDDIKEALLKNKTTIKKKLRNDWRKSKQPTLQIALYKLAANKEELNTLNNNQVEVNHKGTVTLKFDKIFENV